MLLIDKLYRRGKFENSYRAKRDTLWKIAKKYGVDFDTLKKTNTQLSNPDLIMPGMKIKVPSNSVHVKQHAGAGSAPPKQYVKEVQQKRICSNANAAWNRR